MSGPVACHDHGARRDLVLSDPARGNCLSAAMVAALGAALDRAEADGVRLLVLRGAGRHFCTGFDLSDLDTAGDADLLARFVAVELLLARLWSAPLRTAAVVQGRAIGAGADLAACCSLRLARPEAGFAFPGAGFGLILGTRRLGLRLGGAVAAELIASGRTMGAAEARAAGLVTRIATAEEEPALLERETAAAARLAPETAAAMRAALAGDMGALDADLAALVRSAARPGLADRIRAHRARARKQQERTA